VRQRGERSVLITDAARSQAEQLRSRERRYVLMMLTRAVCVVVFAVLVGTRPPLLWLWLTLTGVAAVLLPWLAVLLANDAPPKEKHRIRRPGTPGRPELAPPRSLPAQASAHRTIDVEP
jgi:DUF3099 family protein